MRLYLHNAVGSVDGTPPPANVFGHSVSLSWDAFATLRAMNQAIGTAQTTVSQWTGLAGNTKREALLRFVSPPLLDGVVDAQTWQINFASTNPSCEDWLRYRQNLFVWRPSTGAVVGTIFDDVMVDYGYGIELFPSGQNLTLHHSVSGASVPGAAPGDVVVFELWMFYRRYFEDFYWPVFFDGTIVTASQGSTFTSHAGFVDSSVLYASAALQYTMPAYGPGFNQDFTRKLDSWEENVGASVPKSDCVSTISNAPVWDNGYDLIFSQ